MLTNTRRALDDAINAIARLDDPRYALACLRALCNAAPTAARLPRFWAQLQRFEMKSEQPITVRRSLSVNASNRVTIRNR